MATAKSSQSPSAKRKKSPKTTPKVASAPVSQEGPRRVKAPKRRIWRPQDKRFKQRPKLPSAFVITKQATHLMVSNWKVIGTIVIVYGLLNIILVRGLNGGLNVSELKSEADLVFQGSGGHLLSGFTVLGLLLTSSNNVASAAASAYQTFLLLIVSLALVWSYRQLLGGITIRARDGFYRGIGPLVPVVLVLLVVGLELIPLLIGGWLYTILIQNGIAVTGLEQFVTVVLFIALTATTVYLTCSTIFALYIATLPDMTPLRAMRSARELVRYRRWPIIRKLLFLPLVLLVLVAIIMLPCILFAPIIAQWVFFVLTMLLLPAVHAYLYTLYRELINE